MNLYATPVVIGILSLFAQSINAFDVEPYPELRFRDYNELKPEEKEAAAVLGYSNAESWSKLGTADAEGWSWWYNANRDYYDYNENGNYYEENPTFIPAATTLGFTEDVWDCWINHYGSYEWEDLKKYDITSFYRKLGWTKDKWNEIDTVLPDTEGKSFAELSTEEKTAAVTVCYTQKIWDKEMLPFCVDSPRPILVGGKQERSCDWVSRNLSRCKNKKGEFSKHCPNTCGTCDINECAQTKLKVLWHQKGETKVFKKCAQGLLGKGKKERNCKKQWVRNVCPATCSPKCQPNP
uniref:ShKT domain-containing protein n=1 Tax=Chaetoceros debilis TaxID=122233 RepID=A0A7S3Q2A0_9STRA